MVYGKSGGPWRGVAGIAHLPRPRDQALLDNDLMLKQVYYVTLSAVRRFGLVIERDFPA